MQIEGQILKRSLYPEGVITPIVCFLWSNQCEKGDFVAILYFCSLLVQDFSLVTNYHNLNPLHECLKGNAPQSNPSSFPKTCVNVSAYLRREGCYG